MAPLAKRTANSCPPPASASTASTCAGSHSRVGSNGASTRAPTKRRLAGQTSGFRCGPKDAAIALGVLQIIVEVMALFLTIIACEYLPCSHWVG